MADLKIRVFKLGADQPKTTITIPGSVLKVASTLFPKLVAQELERKGIDVDEIVKLSLNPDISGTLIEIEEHDKGEKVVVALE